MSRVAGTVVAIGVLAAALAGCGSSGSPFKKHYETDQAQIVSVSAALSSLLASTRSLQSPQLASELQGYAATLERDVEALASMTPPSKLLRAYEQLLTAGAHVVVDLRTIATASTAHQTAAARSAIMTLTADGQQLSGAAHSIDAGLGLPPS
ncbi:MAG TPA: hypothetical protein VHX88_15985 [Solirubrobacteraceae bacterium]|jgi:hypothetical protein|nr:hypothetical protein [Solirubrobacteraceae bacterium]